MHNKYNIMKIHSVFSKLKLYTYYIDFILKICYAYVSNLKAIFPAKYFYLYCI